MSPLESLLPSPRPDDDEDVVWGLSTASALWGRGERRDAVVWLRRAVDAAKGVGAGARAAEIEVAAAKLEAAMSVPEPPPSGSVDVELDDEVTVAAESAAVRAAADLAMRRATEPARAPGSVHIPGPTRPSARPSAPRHTSSSPPAVTPFAPSPSFPPPAATNASPAPPAVAPVVAATPAPPVAAPVAATPAPPAVAPAPAPAPAVARPASPAASPAAAAARVPRQRPRAPILDPWAGPPPALPPDPPATAGSSDLDDDDVITSAVPLSVATRRRGKAPKGAAVVAADPAVAQAPASAPGAEVAAPVLVEPVIEAPVDPAPAPPPTEDPPTPPRALSRPIPAPPPPPPPSDTPPPELGGLPLSSAPRLATVPTDVQEQLVAAARLDVLRAHAELEGFGAVLVVRGHAALSAAIVPAPVERLGPGALVPARGSLAQGVPLRITAGPEGAEVALWTPAAFEAALRWCPWVLDDLERVSNRLQALAGATMGPLGDLDEATRAHVAARLELRVARAGEVVAERGAPLTGTTILGAGLLDLEGRGEVHPGDVLFPRAASTGAPAPTTARAGLGGALLLVGEPGLLAELSASVPALADILGG